MCASCTRRTLESHGKLRASRQEALERTAARISQKLSEEPTERQRLADIARADEAEQLNLLDGATSEALDEVRQRGYGVEYVPEFGLFVVDAFVEREESWLVDRPGHIRETPVANLRIISDGLNRHKQWSGPSPS